MVFSGTGRIDLFACIFGQHNRSKVFKTGALKEGDRVEITSGEHCGFTGRILQIYPGQNAIRVFIETISGTKIDVVLKREQLCKLPLKSENKILAS